MTRHSHTIISYYKDDLFYLMLIYNIIENTYLIIDIDKFNKELTLLSIIKDNYLKSQIKFEWLIRYLNGYVSI